MGFLKRPNRATTAAYGHTKNDTHTFFFHSGSRDGVDPSTMGWKCSGCVFMYQLLDSAGKEYTLVILLDS